MIQEKTELLLKTGNQSRPKVEYSGSLTFVMSSCFGLALSISFLYFRKIIMSQKLLSRGTQPVYTEYIQVNFYFKYTYQWYTYHVSSTMDLERVSTLGVAFFFTRSCITLEIALTVAAIFLTNISELILAVAGSLIENFLGSFQWLLILYMSSSLICYFLFK